mgnify:CR=1 FL=1
MLELRNLGNTEEQDINEEEMHEEKKWFNQEN